jgi:hypothetical protein
MSSVHCGGHRQSGVKWLSHQMSDGLLHLTRAILMSAGAEGMAEVVPAVVEGLDPGVAEVVPAVVEGLDPGVAVVGVEA